MSAWLGLEKWLPKPGAERPDREFSRIAVSDDGIEARVKLYFTPCEHCTARAATGERFDDTLLILSAGVGHLMVAANRPLCEETLP